MGKIGIFILSVGLMGSLILDRTAAADFFGSVATGLQQASDDRYGYSFYVPEDYTPEKLWTLVVALHDESANGEAYLQTWIDEVQKRGMILLCPTYPIPRDHPAESDKRILKLKQLIESRYSVDRRRILVTGTGFGGHYAFYLGLRYPKEFSAVASIGNGMEGRLEQFFYRSYARANRLPFLTLVEKNSSETSSARSALFEELRARGYSVETAEADQWQSAPSIATSYILDWFAQASADDRIEQYPLATRMREKTLEWVDQLFHGT